MAEDWLQRSLAGASTGAGIGAAVGAPAGGIGAAPGALIGAGIGFLAPIIGDLIGQAFASGDKEKARRLLDEAVAQYGPDILKEPSIAELTPHLPPSRFETAQADPQARAAQSEALTELRRLSKADNIEFRGAMNEAEQAANQQAGAQQGAVEQQMAARGMGGSGVDYALRAQAGQDAANRSSSAGFSAAAEGRRQALQALTASGGLASTIRGQSWGEQRDKSSAADEINRLNEMGRAGAVQQAHQNTMGVAGARAGVLQNAAGVARGDANQTQQQWAGYGAGAGMAAGALGQYLDGAGRSKNPDDEPQSGSKSRGY